MQALPEGTADADAKKTIMKTEEFLSNIADSVIESCGYEVVYRRFFRKQRHSIGSDDYIIHIKDEHKAWEICFGSSYIRKTRLSILMGSGTVKDSKFACDGGTVHSTSFDIANPKSDPVSWVCERI